MAAERFRGTQRSNLGLMNDLGPRESFTLPSLDHDFGSGRAPASMCRTPNLAIQIVAVSKLRSRSPPQFWEALRLRAPDSITECTTRECAVSS